MIERRFLKPAEFAGMLGLSQKRIQNLLSIRQVPGQVKIFGSWRIDFQRFSEMVETNIVIPQTWRGR
jgi:predicted DNA-binding transcriptional regulator AlpA